MGNIENQIKDFVRQQGIEIVGVAGPERLDGPPSLDPSYTMKGARSIVSMAAPMNVDAIYKFLGKESNYHHNLDQTRMNTRLYRTAANVAGYIESLGYRARAVPSNNSYRRSPDAFATHPSFSHRFGAIAAGVAAQGWSGNVMTAEHGAAVYLGTVVTEAELASDPPRFSPRHFIDEYCAKCRICEKTCVAGMFEPKQEEYVLINGELHPRGKRYDLLQNGGFVVPGPDNEATVADTYEKACEMREKYTPRIPLTDQIKDFAASTVMWHQYYGGIEPRSIIAGSAYERKLHKAVEQRLHGHSENKN